MVYMIYIPINTFDIYRITKQKSRIDNLFNILVLIMMMKAVVTMKRRILNQPQLQAKLKATTKLFMVLLEQEKAHRLKKFIEKIHQLSY